MALKDQADANGFYDRDRYMMPLISYLPFHFKPVHSQEHGPYIPYIYVSVVHSR